MLDVFIVGSGDQAFKCLTAQDLISMINSQHMMVSPGPPFLYGPLHAAPLADVLIYILPVHLYFCTYLSLNKQ